MKKIFILLLLAASLSGSAFASGEQTVNPQAVAAFQQTFSQASGVAWYQAKDLYKVEFKLNSQYVTGWYNHEGELIALVKNIASNQLPLILETNLKSQYQGYWISELFEVSTDEDVTYYVTLENADTKLTLRSNKITWDTYVRKAK